MAAKPIERFVIRHWSFVWLRWRLWLIWTPWLNWFPFRWWRGWKNRHQKAVISGFAGFTSGGLKRGDAGFGIADVYEDSWPRSR